MPKSKSEVEQELASRVGLLQERVREIFEALAELAYDEVGEGFRLRGFGEFCITRGEGRTGRNPFTGKKVFFEGPLEVAFTPDDDAKKRFLGRKNRPVQPTWEAVDPRPIPEIRLHADSSDWEAATGGPGGSTNSKIGGEAGWIQADETPACCGGPTRFCGQLDLAHVDGPEMLYVFFCDRCHTPSSVYQCT